MLLTADGSRFIKLWKIKRTENPPSQSHTSAGRWTRELNQRQQQKTMKVEQQPCQRDQIGSISVCCVLCCVLCALARYYILSTWRESHKQSKRGEITEIIFIFTWKLPFESIQFIISRTRSLTFLMISFQPFPDTLNFFFLCFFLCVALSQPSQPKAAFVSPASWAPTSLYSIDSWIENSLQKGEREKIRNFGTHISAAI